MSGIVGTVIEVRDLYENKNTKITFKNGTEERDLIELKKDRIYKIPLFQREIRWKKNNLLTLIHDVEHNSKFLGNIILSKMDSGHFEILDGQQRTTIILLILQYIRKKHGTRIKVFESCKLNVESFKFFNKAFEMSFDISGLAPEEQKEINESDDYQQLEKYAMLWKELEKFKHFDQPAYAEDFLKNLNSCQMNVIINTENAENAISCFLDVNLKGVKLDTEDIFKSYLFAQDESEEIHSCWSNIKKLDVLISNKKAFSYPMMLIIEHYLRSKLAHDKRFSNIEFNSEFLLSSDQTIEDKQYNEGTHIITVIHDKSLMQESLSRVKDVMEIMCSMIDSTFPSGEFRTKIKEHNNHAKEKEKIDEDEITVIYNLVRKVLKDKDKVPNCLVVKYLSEVVCNPTVNKDEYNRIYGISATALMFSLYEDKKNTNKIDAILKAADWNNAMSQYVYSHLSFQRSNDRKIMVAYKYNRTEQKATEVTPQQFRCKTLATIFNFYDVTEKTITIKNGVMKPLISFLTDSEKYSVEHFIINDSGTCDITLDKDNTMTYRYPDNIAVFKDSLLNYIFISRSNNDALGNRLFSYKIKMIENERKEEFSSEECGYSLLVIDIAKKSFKLPDIDNKGDESEIKKCLDEYYLNRFPEEMTKFSSSILDNLINRNEG